MISPKAIVSDANDQTLFIGGNASASAVATPEAVGFKAYNLWRMEKIGMPVPQDPRWSPSVPPYAPRGAPHASRSRHRLAAPGSPFDFFRPHLRGGAPKLLPLAFRGRCDPVPRQIVRLVATRAREEVYTRGTSLWITRVGSASHRQRCPSAQSGRRMAADRKTPINPWMTAPGRTRPSMHGD